MRSCIERVKADPQTRQCVEHRCLGPELDLDELVTHPRSSLGYACAKVMSISATPPHFYGDRPDIAEWYERLLHVGVGNRDSRCTTAPSVTEVLC
jgi:ubiquinone biosynthesis protein Coq4